MQTLNISIHDTDCNNYGEFCLRDGELGRKTECCDCIELTPKNSGDSSIIRPLNRWKTIRIDAAFLHYLVNELGLSEIFRKSFLKRFIGDNVNSIRFILRPTKKDLIDYGWNERVYHLVRERSELDHALSWLSTLGGAFSALGDYFENCAETAGKISIHQLQLALRLGDPNIAARCRLYLSLSLIQKKKFKLARKIIENEYKMTKNAPVVDQRLINMCKGIWSKLQYESQLCRKIKNRNKKS